MTSTAGAAGRGRRPLAALRLGPLAIGYLLACSVVNWVADALQARR